MAKKEKQEKQKKQPKEKEKTEAPVQQSPAEESKASSGIFGWLLTASVVIAGSVGGFATAQFMKGTAPPAAEVKTEPQTKTFEDLLAKTPQDSKVWPFEIDPVIANLDEPGVTRYARVAITLELSPEMDKENGALFLEEKKSILRDFLTTYLAGLNIERVRGTSNLTRIKKEIKDQFNEILFADSKPFVVNILFKEFAIQ